uniref:Aminoglycoside phosphotransferase domain-containing protein n=1 Tax=Alexandrium monilatum TaxID=311494 RepID=A0A7S4UBR7_9DINO
MEEMCTQNLKGHWSEMTFPHNSQQLKEFGPQWYTDAFHRFGTLPEDNAVTKVVKVEQLPHSGFDAAGGAGHKAFVTVEYKNPDPELHTELFAKFPWDFFESPQAAQYRMQISTYSDADSGELQAYIFMEHLFPFRIPKLYYCDINRKTTNYVIITERLAFGKRGKVKDGKITEKIERPPFTLWPVCGKYQDFLLEDPLAIYLTLFRAMAKLAAWDQLGHYNSFLGPMPKYDEEGYLAQFPMGRKQKAKRFELLSSACGTMIDQGIEFATKVAPWAFTPQGKDPKMLEKMRRDICEMAPHFDDIRTYTANTSDWIGAMHMNLQADNAFFWADEDGQLDCGVFDWCGFARVPFMNNFYGCLSGAESDFMDQHEEAIMKMFCDEYERYGGPHLDWEEVLRRNHLIFISCAMDACQWVERDIYREHPKAEWPKVKSKWDDAFMNKWNVRCRGTTLINTFDFWPRRDFKEIFDTWKEGDGRRYVTRFED